MEFFEIIDRQSGIEHSNLPVECSTCSQSAAKGISCIQNSVCGKRKRWYEEDEFSSTYFCSNEEACIGSNKIFRTKVAAIKSIVPLLVEYKKKLSEDLSKQNKRIFHNVITLNGHNIQELYALVSDKILSNKVELQRDIIRKNIEKEVDAAVNMFLRIAKNNLAIQTNFNVFNKLSEANPIINLRKHKIRRVLLTVYHVFFQDFLDKHVQVIIGDADVDVLADFESLSVAFYHILDNATKYILDNSKLNIKFATVDDRVIVIFDMDSIEIKDWEAERLIEEGYKGENAIKMESEGNGLGMFITNQILKLTNGKLTINPNINSKKAYHIGICYCRNQFLVELTKA